MIRKVVIIIDPDHLLFNIVNAFVQAPEITYLDRIILSGLMLFADNNGVVTLTQHARRKMEDSLSISTQGLTNTIKRLKRFNLITGSRGQYLLAPSLTPLLEVANGVEQTFCLQFNCTKHTDI